MPLVNVHLPAVDGEIPDDVSRFLRDADRRIDEYQIRCRAPAFVPSNYEGAYRVLQGLADSPLMRGTLFCEWGSGYGVVACLASIVGFESAGIEAEGELVYAARQLAEEYELPVEFAHGSFVPPGNEDRVVAAGEYAWLTTDSDYAYDELGMEPNDFDLIYAYPWPDEEAVTAKLFERNAGPGALLLTFHGSTEFRLRRKTKKSKKTCGS